MNSMVRKASAIERLRRKYLPERVNVLFVGEAAPNGNTFFYDSQRPSKLHYHMRRAMYDPELSQDDTNETFLRVFMKRGLYLDDLVAVPVNQLGSKQERRELRQKGIPDLTKRLRKFHPSAVVAIGIVASKEVRAAFDLSRLPCRFTVVPFPRWPRDQKKFHREMKRILSSAARKQ
jgi:hypothetical protein